MENNPQYVQQDTIDLRELFAILKRRKKMIWGVTSLFTLLALIYVFVVAKPVYEVKAMIQIGQINEKSIDNINDIKQKLDYEYQVNVKDKEIELPRVKAISIPKKSNTILSINIHGYSNEEAIKYIQNVINTIESKYKNKTDLYIDNQKKLIELTQDDIRENQKDLDQLRTQLDIYSEKILSLSSEDAALAGIYALQIGQKQSQLQSLKKHISSLKTKEQNLKLSLTPFKMKPTHLVGEIETLEKPIKPKKKLIVIVAFITGLMLSVFLAFFLEFIKGMKEEEKEV